MNQLRQALGIADIAQVHQTLASLRQMPEGVHAAEAGPARLLSALPELFEQVVAAYEQHDRDVTQLQRRLDLISAERAALDARLQQELSSRAQALAALHDALAEVLAASGLPQSDEAGDDLEQLAAELARLTTERERVRTLLEEGERRYRTLYNGVIDALFVCTFTPEGSLGRFIEVNEISCSRLGYTRAELLGMSLQDIDGSGDAVDMDAIAEELMAGRSVCMETLHITADGRRIPVELHAHAFEMLGHKAALALVRDITDRVHAEEQLQLWPKVFEASREGILIADRLERIVSVNHAVTEITGYPREEIIGQTPRLFSSGKHDTEFYRAMWEKIRSEGHWQGEIWDRRKSGEVYPKWTSISAVRNQRDEVTHYIASFMDISERKATEERIRFLAYHDALTGLPNRMLLRDRFAQEAAHARRADARVVVMLLDLDSFKTVNDSLGHPLGDKLLQAVTMRLLGCLRESDTVSRQGGDEFVVIVSDRSAVENLLLIVHKILDQLSEPFEIEGHDLNTSASIGISLFPDDGDDFDTLLQKADTALYQAKENGRGTYRYYTEQMNGVAIERLNLETSLRGAVERNELEIHYQPQIDLATGLVLGVEALLRWNSPELGTVGPYRFIPVAEESGLIVPIGEWVLREACARTRRWHAAGRRTLTVAVNLSAVQFSRGNLVSTLSRALADSGLDPEYLELELTESILIRGAEDTLATVRQLKNLGVKLSIDDFGTGYSSLSYLKRFAVDRVKIDQSFVRDLPGNADDAAIVRAVIQMAHHLRLTVVAEGVEREDQAAFLRDAGCDVAQGYLFGRPHANPLPAAPPITET